MVESIFLKKNGIDKKFENEVFTCFLFEKGISTEGDIHFYNCTFKNTFCLEDVEARELSFLDCTFEGIFYLYNSSFAIGGFTNCIFLEETKFTSNKFSSFFILRNIQASQLKINGEYQNLQFVSSRINKLVLHDVNFERLNRESKIEFLVENVIEDLRINSFSSQSNITFYSSKYKNVFFEGTFEGAISLKENIRIKNLYFESSTFKKRIDFEQGKFEYVSFYRSIFLSLIVINDKLFSESKSKIIQIRNLTIHSCSFEMDMHLNIQKIKYLDLSNNNFKQLFHFNNYASRNDRINYLQKQKIGVSINGTNQGNIIIEQGYLYVNLSNINFGNIIFKDLDISHLYIKDFQNEGNITFSNIDSGEYFVIQDSITGNINFLNFDVNIFEEIVIANSTLNGINFNIYPNKILSYSKNPIMGFGISNKTKSISNLKSIYNQLKHISRNKGDIDSSIKFQALEYKALLRSKKIDYDTVLLLLNWLSNDNGRSWPRGVIFTLVIGLLFFTLYLKTIGTSFNLYYHYQDYIVFISSFPKLELEKYSCENNNWTTKLVVWLSRIFISYGIYQTIAAFRKYGKG